MKLPKNPKARAKVQVLEDLRYSRRLWYVDRPTWTPEDNAAELRESQRLLDIAIAAVRRAR